MRLVGLSVAVLLHMLATVTGDGHYSIIGPGTLHSNSKYNVAVAVHNNKAPAQLKVGITGLHYNETKTVELQPNEIKNIEFIVPPIKWAEYNLTAEGITGIIFKNTTALSYENFLGRTKIQTDKGKYKPGDIINFRVLYMDENLKPRKPEEDSVVYIEDGKRNRIKEFKNITTVMGVYTDSFKISEFPVLGDWRMIVQNGVDETDAYFMVDKYVLPKFEVSVDATDQVSIRDGDVNVVVKANYTYGKPVDGKATLLLTLFSGESADSPEPPTMIKTAPMVQGKAKFDINIKEYAPFFKHAIYSKTLSVTGTIEENFTGVKINATDYVEVYPYRYQFHCVHYENCSQFVVDEEREVVMKVSLVDDTPIADTKSIVQLVYTEDIREQHYRQWRTKEISTTTTTTTTTPRPVIANKTYTFESHLNATGFATFKVTLPELAEIPDYTHFYRAEMNYLDEKRDVFEVRQYKKPDETSPWTTEEPKEYFKMMVHHHEDRYSFNISEPITVTLNSSESFNHFILNIIARGNLYQHERIDLPDSVKLHNFTIIPTFLMSPHFEVYIYYVDDKGEFHYAEDTVYVEVELQNFIEITAPHEVKPGAEVPLHIKTMPHSFVALTAVDQSVLLLAGSNDLDSTEFNWQLGSYSTSTPWQGGYSRYPGGMAGVVTLTNADYFYNWTKPEFGKKPVKRRKFSKPVHASATVEEESMLNADKTQSVAFGAAAGASQKEIVVRKDFSETWIFDNIEDSQGEEFTWSKKVPDTITSWVISGFSMNPLKGLGVTKKTTKVTTFQPFFIAVRLPYSVKRGEVFNVPALVFNYLNKDLDVEITLDNTDNEYDFTEVSNEIINEPKRTKTVRIPALSSRGVSFMIRPRVIGNILLKFTAVSPIAGDAIHKALKVVPEGVTEYANRAYFVNLKESPEFKDSFALELPSEVVPDSEHVEFSVIGDILGPLLNNLNRLVRMPTGCAEQTTSSMAPNYIVLRYLKGLNKLTPAMEMKIKYNLESGYQHVLSFALDDGSFSSFVSYLRAYGDQNEKPRGSTWLTAYIVRTLGETKKHINVDSATIEKGLEYLATQQAANGSFVESNDFFYAPYRKHITLTANVVLAFLHNETLAQTYQDTIDKALKFIADNIDNDKDKENDMHLKAVATYTLHKAKHAAAKQQLEALKGLAKTDADRKWWTQNPQRPIHGWWRWSFSNDVEITSYILLTLLDQEDTTVDSVVPIVTWLVAQRNSYGGFSSTQDTVVGLTALTKFAMKAGYEAAMMDINVKATGSKEKEETIKVNEENGLLQQIVELPHKTLGVDFEAKGKGAALVQISYQYNVLEKDKKPSFSIKSVINKETPPFKLDMEVCVEYTGDKQASNMALLEISLPSGYVAEAESFKDIEKVPRVRQVETKNSDSVIVVYFESLHKGEMQCVPVEALKSFPVARQKPAPIVLYDYYDTAEKATEYYEVAAKVCDICEDDEECQKACK